MRLLSITLYLLTAAFTCAGDLYWNGYDTFDNAGRGRVFFVKEPVKVATNVAEVATRTTALIWRDTSGTVWGRGSNDFKMIVNSPSYLVEDTTQITTGVTKLLPSLPYTLFVQKTSGLWTKGQDRVGVPTPTYIELPEPTLVGADLAQISVSELNGFYVALKNDATAWAVGSNELGQLGNGNTTSGQNQVGSNVLKVGSTESGGFFLKADHTLWFFGTSSSSVNGTGTAYTNQTPIQVMAGVSDFTTEGTDSVAILKQDTSLWIGGEYIGGAILESWLNQCDDLLPN